MAGTGGEVVSRVDASPRGGLGLVLAPFLCVALLQGCMAAESVEDPGEAGDAIEPVAAALLPLPEAFRDGATILGYGEDGALRPLRQGDGPFICLADDPAELAFHVACYHESLEPYMDRGRELRAEGVTGRDGITRRWEEIEAGRLEMPRTPAVLYSLSREEGPPADADDPSLRRLTVLYVRDATVEETGLPTAPGEGVPWLMFPGTPTAHVMVHD